MKKVLLIIITGFLTLTINADDQPHTKAFEKKITKMIEDSEMLDDFWFGDDGEDCGEPNFSISKIDFKKQTVYLDIYQGKDSYFCLYHLPFQCEMKYKFKKEKLVLPKEIDMLNDCSF